MTDGLYKPFNYLKPALIGITSESVTCSQGVPVYDIDKVEGILRDLYDTPEEALMELNNIQESYLGFPNPILIKVRTQ